MKLFQLGILASISYPFLTMAYKRYDLGGRRGAVAELDGTEQVNIDDQEILIQDGESGMEHIFRCPRGSGTRLSFADGHRFVACCAASQRLVGSAETAFECCAEGHDLAGGKDTGYTCCPTGQIFDGVQCKRRTPVCENGKVLVDGQCACPPGTKENADGTCSKEAECDSGIQEGKCYTLRMENGHLLGFNKAGWYTASVGSRHHMFGKFKFCKSEACNGNSPIDPIDGFRILDLHGDAETGLRRNHWLDNKVNGGHITKTPNFTDAGIFSITKWNCGKFCLSGFEHGLSPTCPSGDPAITFSSGDKQACRPVDVIEVPCDIRDNSNNCFWQKRPGTCGTGDSTSCVC